MLTTILLAVSLAFAGETAPATAASVAEAVKPTLTQEVCAVLQSDYKDMGTPVATLRPFETGERYAVLTAGEQSWNVDYLIEDESVHMGNLWNTFDSATYDVDVYVRKGRELNSHGECIVEYRRYTWRGNDRYEIGRVEVDLVVVEPVHKG